MLIVWTLGIGLAAFRIYRIAGVDSITEPFHGRLNASRTRVGQWFSELVSCPWCMGWWASVVLAVLGWWVGSFGWYDAILITFGASTVCGLIGSVDHALQAHIDYHQRA